MKATILNGSSENDAYLSSIHSLIIDELSTLGWESESFILHQMKITYCVGCFECWVKTPGECRFKDEGRTIARQVIQSDLVVLLTPVTFGGYSAQLKKALDRIICLISPYFKKINGETHHQKRYDDYPRLLGLGIIPYADEQSEHIFTTLVKRNSINMHSPAYKGAVIASDRPIKAVELDIKKYFNGLGISQ